MSKTTPCFHHRLVGIGRGFTRFFWRGSSSPLLLVAARYTLVLAATPMMIFLNSITFFSALLCTVQHTEAEASSSSLTSKFRVLPITTPRGGGSSSESASSWNAGSRFNDYRTISPQHQQSKGYQSTTIPTAYNKQEETVKEVFVQAFQIREDRNRFIMRVYAILSCQLLFTAGTIHAFHLYPSIQEYMLYDPLGRKGLYDFFNTYSHSLEINGQYM